MDYTGSRSGTAFQDRIGARATVKFAVFTAAAAIMSWGWTSCVAAQGRDAEAPYAPGRIIVKCREGVSPDGRQATAGSLEALKARYAIRNARPLFPDFSENVRRLRSLPGRSDSRLNAQEKRLKRRLQRAPRNQPIPALDRVYMLEIAPGSPDSPDDIARAFATHPDIEYAEPDYYVRLCATPNDPLYSEQWALRQIGAPAAWDITTGSADIVVAVLDTGIYDHPDILDNMWVNEPELNGIEGVDDDGNGYIDDIHGYDFANEDGRPLDDHGHGTHVAGIIAACGNNELDVTGVCWSCRIMAVKMVDPDAFNSVSHASWAVAYAVNNGADILSNSWGLDPPSEFLKDTFEYAYSMGVVCVAAAGNDSSSQVFYPAGYEHVISVAATDESGARAYFSNYGSWVDIAAPGMNILSLYFDITMAQQGTSMACPHVSGACALLLSANPYLTPDDIRDTIMSNADSTTAGTTRYDGRLNLEKVLKGAISERGYVRLDAESYSAQDNIAISVADGDLAGLGSQDVAVTTSHGDVEVVSLAETSVAGVFVGTVATGPGPATTDDGIVELVDGDTILVTYNDEHVTSRTGKATVTDSAVADCRAPSLVGIQVLDAGPTPVIALDVDETVAASVIWRASQDSTELVRTNARGWSASHTVVLQGVRSETEYTLTLELTDLAGNVTTDDNGGQGFTLTTDADSGDIYVPEDYLTIQEAVDRCWSGNTVWVADGVYTGQGNRDIIFPAREISVRSINGPESCVIDCQGGEDNLHRAFYLRDRQSRTSVIEGFTITGGYQNGDMLNGIACKGGGILCNGASPTIRNCIFTLNSASWLGGSICCMNQSNPLIEHCSFLDNDCVNRGAAIAVTEDGVLDIVDCQFTRNSAYYGGAIYIETGSAVIEDCAFTENSCKSMGGGVFGGLSMQIRNCTFVGNRADYGGGAVSQGDTVLLANCLFVDNAGADYGGAIYDQSNTALTLLHCTFSGNESPDGNAITLQYYSDDPLIFQATNCIFQDGLTWLSCDEEIEPKVTYSAVEGGWPGIGNHGEDARFVAPDTGDFHLAFGSPCIDAGTSEIDDLPADDLDGLSRSTDGNDDGIPVPDMGAYEYQPQGSGFGQ